MLVVAVPPGAECSFAIGVSVEVRFVGHRYDISPAKLAHHLLRARTPIVAEVDGDGIYWRPLFIRPVVDDVRLAGAQRYCRPT